MNFYCGIGCRVGWGFDLGYWGRDQDWGWDRERELIFVFTAVNDAQRVRGRHDALAPGEPPA